MLRAPGSNVSSSVQRSRPARKVTSQCDTVTVLGHLGDGDAPDGVAEFGVPLEVGERLVHVARWFIRHVEPEAGRCAFGSP